VVFRKEGNCFTELADAPGLQHVADTLRSKDAIGRWRQVCERWLSRCLCFALTSAEQQRTNFGYELSMFQLEYSRNFLFHRGRALEQIFQGLIDRTRTTLDIKTIKTILGCKQRPQKKGKTRWEITVETPEYGLTIFKVHAGALTLKIYTKGERVLRCEIMLHNARKLNLGTSLERWPLVVEHLQGVLERFIEVVQCADQATIDDGTYDALPKASQVGKSRVAGLHLSSQRLAAVLDAALALAPKPGGFTSGELAAQVRQRLHDSPAQYRSRQAAYDLKKLRGKKLVERIAPSHRYQSSAEGLRTMVALAMLRHKVLKPVLRNRNLQGPPPRNNNAIDHHYYNLRQEMRRLFRTLNIAA
jgi:alpha-D-ribose 1-methylphosphonate 5-triphosphate synthase subunit PhnG